MNESLRLLLAYEFWQLGQTEDGRTPLYVTEADYNYLRSLFQPAKVPDPEEAIEVAFWDFDARKKGYGRYAGTKSTERDAFKWSVREAFAAGLRKPIKAQHPRQLECGDADCQQTQINPSDCPCVTTAPAAGEGEKS